MKFDTILKLVSCALLFAGPNSLNAATALVLESLPQSWSVDCDSEQSCVLSRAAINKEDGQRLATVAVSLSSVGRSLTVTTPLGVAVEAGVRLMFENQTYVIPIRVCFPTGCLAGWSIPAETLQSLSAANELEVRYFPHGNPNPIAIRMDIDGLAEAMTKHSP